MTEEELKMLLIQLENEDIELDELNVDTVVDEILRHTQTADIELKEHYMEKILKRIIRGNYISEDSLEELAKLCINEKHLYLDIGDTAGRSKMTRSFAMYILKQLLERDAEDVFISNALYNTVRKEVLLYLDLEQDYRIYTAEMGWVNSILYGFECIYAMIRNTRLDSSYYTELFQALMNKLFTYNVIYESDEEELVVASIQALMTKGFDENKLIDFFTRVPHFLETQKEKLNNKQYWNLYKNCKSLLQVMYIQVDLDNEYPLLLVEVKNCLKKIEAN